ncbi:MAG: ATP-binding protein [Bacteroidetes bacterium HGW-Bacteroidetes-15]|nr:MAG: ATP-binding protein [Bacteroidetes bacterium HGW-Bacteroidetes-15]
MFLLVAAIFIGFASLFITNRLVKELSHEERKKIELWAEAIRELSQISTMADTNQNFTIIFEVLQNNTTVPVILADENDSVLSFRNIPIHKIDSKIETEKLLRQMKASKEPIEVTLLDNTKNFIYYKDSTTLVKLTYYPYIQIAIIILFILASYYAFSRSRRAEQNQVWVGMAKETAHQLGTPTSSLLAWHEILKESNLKVGLVENFGKDIARLEKIVDRFSKIGSTPSLSPHNLVEVINNTIDYLSNRISNKIEIVKAYEEKDYITVPINETLFEWVIENIIKNSIDAISSSGAVKVSITDNTQVVFIDVTDTGRGIPRTHFKTIFQPGYTTKKRGWGLGLTLSKRIIEDYHNGKVFVNYSEIDKGTTFRIVLNKS